MITRRPLRDDVYREILDRIDRGHRSPGGRIRDTLLASELGVSRTPVREALLRLESEGLLEADLGRGFAVRPLGTDEIGELYPILWTLECLALRLAVPLAPAHLAELARINAELERERSDPAERLELDERWHRLLVAGAPNAQLLEMIEGLRHRIRRYEFAFMREFDLAVSTRDHAEILGALELDDVNGAAAALQRNWRQGMEKLVRWLERGS